MVTFTVVAIVNRGSGLTLDIRDMLGESAEDAGVRYVTAMGFDLWQKTTVVEYAVFAGTASLRRPGKP